jgi:hypothetical protein
MTSRQLLLDMAKAYRSASEKPTTTRSESDRWWATADELEAMAEGKPE